LIYSDPDHPEYHFGTLITPDGNWLELVISKDTAPANKLWIAKINGGALPPDGDSIHSSVLTSGHLEWIKIKDDFDYGLAYIANNGNVFYFESNQNAPKSKVVRYDLDNTVYLRMK
jgi:prolyl oligopeptidase